MYVAGVLLWLCGCMQNPVQNQNGGGTTIEVVAFSSSALFGDSTPAQAAEVYLYPHASALTKAHDDRRNRFTTTDETGTFSFSNIVPGTYKLTITASSPSSAPFASSTPVLIESQSEQTNAEPAILNQTSSLSGTINLPSGATGETTISLYATPFATTVSAADQSFLLERIPQGTYTLLIKPQQNGLGTFYREVHIGSQPMSIAPVSFLPQQQENIELWKSKSHVAVAGSQKLAGAPIHSPQVALVVLDSSEVDFSRIGAFGQDIRPRLTDGEGLAHYIEHIDLKKQRALLWIRLPASTAPVDSIEILYDNPLALSRSSQKDVFATAEHFSATWLLTEQGIGESGEFQEACGSEHNGTGGALSPESTPRRAETPTGVLQYFDGKNDFISVNHSPEFSPSGPFSFAIRTRLHLQSEKTEQNRRVILRKRHNQRPWYSYELSIRYEEQQPVLAFRWVNENQTYFQVFHPLQEISGDPQQLLHIICEYDSGNIGMWVNNRQLTTGIDTVSGQMFRSTGALRIGASHEFSSLGNISVEDVTFRHGTWSAPEKSFMYTNHLVQSVQ